MVKFTWWHHRTPRDRLGYERWYIVPALPGLVTSFTREQTKEEAQANLMSLVVEQELTRG